MHQKITITILLFIIWNSASTVLAQGESSYWYFGKNAGINFNPGLPHAINDGQLITLEGGAAISDSAGNLLFYTDGNTVWNRNHAHMNNGLGLAGGTGSSTQSALIIPKPGSGHIYYIFTSDELAGSSGISYSVIDITLDFGLGTVISKNIQLYAPACEKLTAVKHCNKKDIWIITHDWQSDAFKVFLLDSSGINTNPVVSHAGLIVSEISSSTVGFLKASPDGRKLASATMIPPSVELFDFDNATGTVSNSLSLFQKPGSYPYGIEFSADGGKLYATVGFSGKIYQYDLCAGSDSAIMNSGILISDYPTWAAALQLGPDKKIYASRYNSSFMGVINSPDVAGTGCNYIDDAVSLNGQSCTVGLPNFPSWYFAEPPDPLTSFSVSLNCLSGSFVAPSGHVKCNASSGLIKAVEWNFDDSSSLDNFSTLVNPIHNFTSAGSYHVVCIVKYSCSSDTLFRDIYIQPLSMLSGINGGDTICSGQSTTLTVSGGNKYSWNTGDTLSSLSISPVSTTVYSVTVTQNSECSEIISHTVSVKPAPGIKFSGNDSICEGNNVTITANGGEIYAWSSGENTPDISVSPLKTTSFTVTATLGNGCSDSSTKTIFVSPFPNAEIYSHDSICSGSIEMLVAAPSENYLWNTGDISSEIPISPMVTSLYTLITTNSLGCSDTAVKLIHVKTPPNVRILGNDNICFGDSIQLIASGGGNYLWSTNETTPMINVESVTDTRYSVIVGDGICTDTAIMEITVRQKPIIDLRLSENGNTSYQLSASGGDQFEWSPPDGLSCVNCASPKTVETTTYCVKVTDINGCYDSACLTIKVNPVYIPNSFTPDNNDLNEVFIPQLLDVHNYSLEIYNSWGALIFKSADPAEGWDGKIKGKICPEGVYVYKLKYVVNAENIERSLIGDVTLIRQYDF